MIARFFLAAGLVFFDIAHLARAAGTAEAFVWAGLLAVTTPLLVATAKDLHNEH